MNSQVIKWQGDLHSTTFSLRITSRERERERKKRPASFTPLHFLHAFMHISSSIIFLYFFCQLNQTSFSIFFCTPLGVEQILDALHMYARSVCILLIKHYFNPLVNFYTYFFLYSSLVLILKLQQRKDCWTITITASQIASPSLSLFT